MRAQIVASAFHAHLLFVALVELVLRLRALTFKLLPVEVQLDSISEPSSRIITPEVRRCRRPPRRTLVLSSMFEGHRRVHSGGWRLPRSRKLSCSSASACCWLDKTCPPQLPYALLRARWMFVHDARNNGTLLSTLLEPCALITPLVQPRTLTKTWVAQRLAKSSLVASSITRPSSDS